MTSLRLPTKAAAKPKALSPIEERFALHCRVSNLEPVREFVFAPPRKWRSDFAFVDQKLLIELEGGIWTGGRHTRGKGFENDAEKLNAATLLGYRVLRFSGNMVKSGLAIETVIEALREVA